MIGGRLPPWNRSVAQPDQYAAKEAVDRRSIGYAALGFFLFAVLFWVFASSLQVAELAPVHGEQAGDEQSQAIATSLLAGALVTIGDFGEAEPLLEEVISHWKRTNRLT